MNAGNTFTLKGLTFRTDVERDDSQGEPWKEHDGHGNVREINRRTGCDAKAPGERVLHEGGDIVYLYDWQGAMALAKRDGWGLCETDKAKLAARLGRDPKPGDVRAEAVQQDFDYCRRWLESDWYWCGVVVTLLDVDGEPTRERESLWGIESDAHDYHDEAARELANEIAGRIGRRKYVETGAVRARVR